MDGVKLIVGSGGLSWTVFANLPTAGRELTMGGAPGFVYTTYGARDACDKIQGRLPRISETTDAEARQFYELVNASSVWRQSIFDNTILIFSGSAGSLHTKGRIYDYYTKIVQLRAPPQSGLSVVVKPHYRVGTTQTAQEYLRLRPGEGLAEYYYPVVCLRGENTFVYYRLLRL